MEVSVESDLKLVSFSVRGGPKRAGLFGNQSTMQLVKVRPASLEAKGEQNSQTVPDSVFQISAILMVF